MAEGKGLSGISVHAPGGDEVALDGEAAKAYRRQVREYYSRALDAYLEAFGDCWQSGILPAAAQLRGGADAADPIVENHRRLIELAAIRPGDRILDAGCGVGGPALHIADQVPDTVIDGITIGTDQAERARASACDAAMAERVRPIAGDFHDLPYADSTFDGVLFLETLGYAYDLARLMSGVRRVLRPGGFVYIKGVFLEDRPLQADEDAERREVERLYAHRSITERQVLRSLEDAGLVDIERHDYPGLSLERFGEAMFAPQDRSRVSEFGRLHHRAALGLAPLFYRGLRARRASA